MPAGLDGRGMPMNTYALLSPQGVANASLTVGDAVLFVTLIQQLYAPLNYFGARRKHPALTSSVVS